MKKLRLEMEELSVESFDAGSGTERIGTVHGMGPHTPLCDSWQICLPKDPETGEASCEYVECTRSCQYTVCVELGGCYTVYTCAPDPTCSLEC